MSIVLGGAFRPAVNILEYSPILKEEHISTVFKGIFKLILKNLSVFQTGGLPENSPLAQSLVRKLPEPKKGTEARILCVNFQRKNGNLTLLNEKVLQKNR